MKYKPVATERLEPFSTGVWGVMATPFVGSRIAVDERSLVYELDHYGRMGAASLTELSVFGEAACLSLAERWTVVESVTEASENLPLVVGLTSLATAPAFEECALW